MPRVSHEPRPVVIHLPENSPPLVIHTPPESALIDAQPPVPAFSRDLFVAFRTAVLDGGGQVPSKLTALAMFALAAKAVSEGDVTAVTAAAIAFGGVATGTVAGKIAMHQFGTDSVAGKAASALSAVAGGVAGMAFASGDAVAAGSAAAAGLYAGLLMSAMRYMAHRRGEDITTCEKAVAALSAVGVGAVGYYAGSQVLAGSEQVPHGLGNLGNTQFLARQLGAVFESILVESFKDMLSGVGPSVDRKGLSFEGRLMAANLGWAVFGSAGFLINAKVGSKTLPQTDGVNHHVDFFEQAPAVALSCLVNLVRGGFNVLPVLRLWSDWRREGVHENPHLHKPKAKTRAQRVKTVADRAAVRHMLILARNAIYGYLRDSGHTVSDSVAIAGTIYSVFAQHRDLFADLMAGEGWTPEARHGLT